MLEIIAVRASIQLVANIKIIAPTKVIIPLSKDDRLWFKLVPIVSTSFVIQLYVSPYERVSKYESGMLFILLIKFSLKL